MLVLKVLYHIIHYQTKVSGGPSLELMCRYILYITVLWVALPMSDDGTYPRPGLGILPSFGHSVVWLWGRTFSICRPVSK